MTTTFDDPTAQPIEVVIRLTIGVEAFAKLRAQLKGHDDDVLLAIETLLVERVGRGVSEDPHESTFGLWIDDLAVVTDAGEFQVVG